MAGEPIQSPPQRKYSNSENHKKTTEAHAEYHETYRKILHHAEILGSRRELRTAIKAGRAAAIFNDTNEMLKDLGAITPRPKSPSIVSPSAVAFITGTGEETKSFDGSPLHQLWRSNTDDQDDEVDAIGYNPESPRAIFLAGCVQQRIPPRSIAMLRKRFSPKLNLSHMSIGNKIAFLLADALVKMPYLQVLNLADNNLDDNGLEAIIRAAAIHGTLEELDVSHNVIDEKAANALADYIGHPNCRLKTLRMSSAGIDDRECARFVEVLMKNRNLVELDLSKNLLGKDENLNVVKPDFVTGGESIAELLRDSACPLSTLVLHWNMIRLEGAEVLCDSIRENRFLTHLDLSYNALGSSATCILGEALMENNKLRHLNLSNNSIDAIAAMTVSISLRENWSLREVILDGNPIGEQGVRALMKVVAQEGHRVTLRTLNCDMVCKSFTKLRLDRPVGDYFLNLSRASERAIAYELFNIVANDMNYELSICDLHVVDQPGKSLSTSAFTLGPTAREGGPVESLTFPVQDLGEPTYSYSVFRFDEVKPREYLSVDELEEEKFLEVLIPVGILTTKAIVWAVKKYEIPHTHNFLVTSLPELLNDILAHRKLSEDSPYKVVKDRSRRRSLNLEMGITETTPNDLNKIDSVNIPKFHADDEFQDLDQAILSMESMLASLVDDCQKLLDPRSSGIIDVDAFIEYISQRSKVAKVRLHQLRHTCRCAVKERTKVSSPKSQKANQRGEANRPGTSGNSRPSTGTPAITTILRYFPPHSGWMHMKLIESFDITNFHNRPIGGIENTVDADEVNDPTSERPGGYTLSKAKCARFVEEMRKATKSQPLSLLMFALENTWLRLEEAKTIYAFGRNRMDDPTLLLSVIVTRMVNCFEARKMVQFAVGDDILKLRRLKQRLGSAYYPLLGVYTGFYSLDLSNSIDRKCLKSLIEKSVKDHEHRRKVGLWDTSQHGQWSSFRNEYFRAPRSVVSKHGGRVPPASSGLGRTHSLDVDDNDSLVDEGGEYNGGDDDASLVTFSANSMVASVVAGFQSNLSAAPRGPSVIITPKTFVPIPEKGRIEFDFVNLHRPEDLVHRRAIHETIIIDALLLGHMIDEDEVEWAFGRLHQHSIAIRRSLLPLGNPSFQPSLGRAYTIANQLTKMYSSLPTRQKMRREAFQRESTRAEPKAAGLSPTANRRQRESVFRPDPQYVVNKLQSAAAAKKMPKLVDEFVESAHEQEMTTTEVLEHAAEHLGTTSILKNKRLEPQNSRNIRFRSFLHQGNRAAIKISQWGHRMQQVLIDGVGSDAFKASAILEYFEAELGSYWLECRYLAVILEVFGASGMGSRSGMGSYRVELVIVLFDRIIDMHNFDLILAELNSEEHAALWARIGILNIFNPAKCEGGWALNLSRWEERQMVKMLIHLSLAEPGQNWLNQVFALYRDNQPVPAWQLNRVWFSEEGLPRKGTISFEMFAGQGLRLQNCKVDNSLRHMLSNLCFPAQRDFTSELYGMAHHPVVREDANTGTDPTCSIDGNDVAGFSWQMRQERMAEQRIYNALHEHHGIFLHMLNMHEHQYHSIPKDILYRGATHSNTLNNLNKAAVLHSSNNNPKSELEIEEGDEEGGHSPHSPSGMKQQRSVSFFGAVREPSVRNISNSDRPAFNAHSPTAASLVHSKSPTHSMKDEHSSPLPHLSRSDSLLHESNYEHSHDRDISNRYPPATRFSVDDIHDHLRATTDVNWTYTNCNRKPADWTEALH